MLSNPSHRHKDPQSVKNNDPDYHTRQSKTKNTFDNAAVPLVRCVIKKRTVAKLISIEWCVSVYV